MSKSKKKGKEPMFMGIKITPMSLPGDDKPSILLSEDGMKTFGTVDSDGFVIKPLLSCPTCGNSIAKEAYIRFRELRKYYTVRDSIDTLGIIRPCCRRNIQQHPYDVPIFDSPPVFKEFYSKVDKESTRKGIEDTTFKKGRKPSPDDITTEEYEGDDDDERDHEGMDVDITPDEV